MSTKSHEYTIWEREDGIVGLNTITSISRGSGSFTIVGSETPPTRDKKYKVRMRTADFPEAKRYLRHLQSKAPKPTMKAKGLFPVHGQSGPVLV